jgi:hypothetical protein
MGSAASFAAAALAALMAGACAERGDFGLPKETALSAFVSPLAGPTESSFPFTDDERELRERAWRFLMPAKERTFFDGLIYDMARVGFIDADYFPETLTWYREALMDERFRSPASRFAQLAGDASADRALATQFAAVAARVAPADRRRLQAMRNVRDLEPAEATDARVRVRENGVLIGWVCGRLAMRAASYRHALEHIFVAAPQAEAVGAERALLLLEQDLRALRATGCVRPDPFADIALDRGLRMPPDGHFWSERVIEAPAAAPRMLAPPQRIVK